MWGIKGDERLFRNGNGLADLDLKKIDYVELRWRRCKFDVTTPYRYPWIAARFAFRQPSDAAPRRWVYSNVR
jgi:hypothetical protein